MDLHRNMLMCTRADGTGIGRHIKQLGGWTEVVLSATNIRCIRDSHSGDYEVYDFLDYKAV
jgi:hypothetical protein